MSTAPSSPESRPTTPAPADHDFLVDFELAEPPPEPKTGSAAKPMAAYTPLMAAFDKLEGSPRKRAMLAAIANCLPGMTDRDCDFLLAAAEHLGRGSGR